MPIPQAWITISIDSSMARYVLELVDADAARMRQLLQHGKSRGERTLSIPQMVMAEEFRDVVLIALAAAMAKGMPGPEVPEWLIGASNDELSWLAKAWACLDSEQAREAVKDGIASAAVLLEPKAHPADGEGEVIGPGARGEPVPASKPDRGEPFERSPQPHEE